MLENKINDMLKEALKARKEVEVSVLRMLIADVKNRKIEERVKDQLEDEKVINVIQKMVKKHKESIENFKKGGREDLVKKETEEMAVLEEFLPEEISPEELSKIVEEAIASAGATSPKDMGAVMKLVMGKVSGRADGKEVNRIVASKLNKQGGE